MIEIKQASSFHLKPLLNLFEAYQQFYQMPSQTKLAEQFLKQRLSQNDAIIFLAFYQQQAAGFCQIYPSFSSLAMQPIWQLNDLYVAQEFRRNGIAKALMQQVKKSAKQQAVFSIKLATAVDNEQAQKLYQSLGYQKNTQFEFYSLAL
jgi:ribosomal protein S18 acetylase RimI-like enzyme